jgi:hypothetical protein
VQALEKIGQAAVKSKADATSISQGSIVVTLQEGVLLQLGSETIAHLPKGTQLKVLRLKGDWVGVRAEIGGQPKSGWVQKTQVGLP